MASCGRYPNLTLRAPAPLTKACAAASDPTMLDNYFYLLEDVLKENGLIEQPCQIDGHASRHFSCQNVVIHKGD